jgi:hypothetical protein
MKRPNLLSALALALSPIHLAAASLTANPMHNAVVGAGPESVYIAGEFVYASNIGPRQEDIPGGNGYISVLSTSGEIIEQNIIPPSVKLNKPMGMAIIDHILYVADVDHVVGIDLKSRNKVLDVDLSSTGEEFLNDIAAVDESHLVVSGTNQKKLFLINLAEKNFKEITTDITLDHPNGLKFDKAHQELLVVQNREHAIREKGNGSLIAFRLDASNAKASLAWELSDLGKFVDGIAISGSDILVSDWVSFEADGTLVHIRRDPMPYVEETLNLNIAGFADFDWDASQSLLVAPNLMEGKVHFFSLR